jgi:hypothetical protein
MGATVATNSREPWDEMKIAAAIASRALTTERR